MKHRHYLIFEKKNINKSKIYHNFDFIKPIIIIIIKDKNI